MSNVTILRRAKKNLAADAEKLVAAFRDLEPDILGLLRSAQMVSFAEESPDGELLPFAIEQNLKLVEEFRRKYYEVYKG